MLPLLIIRAEKSKQLPGPRADLPGQNSNHRPAPQDPAGPKHFPLALVGARMTDSDPGERVRMSKGD